MGKSVLRILYRWALRLHPRAFREEFAEEMLWIFDEEAAKGGTLALFGDGTVSLARQWLLRGGLREGLAAAGNLAPANANMPAPFLWEHIGVEQSRLPARRMLQGSALAILFVVLLVAAAFRPVPARKVIYADGGGAGALGKPGGGEAQRQQWTQGRDGGSKGDPNGDASNGIPGPGDGPPSSLGGIPRVPGGAQADSNSAGTPQQGATAVLSPAERQFHSWLEAFNSGDRAVILEFLQKNYPERAKDIDNEMGFRKMTGGFDFKKAGDNDGTKFSAILKEHGSDQFARLTIEVDAAEPHQIKKLELWTMATPAEFAAPRMSEEDALASLRKEIEKQVAADEFSGTVLVEKNGKTVFSGAYGLADREKKVKNQLDTQFRIGSMNKMFTAVSVLQLAQAGKLKLNATLGEYLPDYPNKDIASKVTVHQLLTHTGGTGDFFGPQFDAHRLELKTLQDYVKLYGQRGPKFEPGSKWEYSNYGFLLLGVVVEKASGQNYYDYVREHVFAPAGMKSTDSAPEDQTVPMRSVGYTKMDKDEAPWKPNTDTLPYRGTSAGGGYSTAGDLARFAEAVKNHKLLDEHYTDLLTTGKAETPGGSKYAYGFMDRMEGGVRNYGHGGGAPGMNGELDIYPESGYVVVALANLDPPAAQRIANFIGSRLPEK